MFVLHEKVGRGSRQVSSKQWWISVQSSQINIACLFPFPPAFPSFFSWLRHKDSNLRNIARFEQSQQKWSVWVIPLSCVTLTEHSQRPANFPPVETLPEKLISFFPHSSNPADVRALRSYCDLYWLTDLNRFTFHLLLICSRQKPRFDIKPPPVYSSVIHLCLIRSAISITIYLCFIQHLLLSSLSFSLKSTQNLFQTNLWWVRKLNVRLNSSPSWPVSGPVQSGWKHSLWLLVQSQWSLEGSSSCLAWLHTEGIIHRLSQWL